MKNKLIMLLSAAVLALVIGLNAQTSTTPSAPAAAPPAGQTPPGLHHERHPAIRRAIGALERARTELQNANHDFGGHRADALQAVDTALAQLRLALQYDKN